MTRVSPRIKARIVGVLYLAGLVIAASGELALHGKLAYAAGYIAIAMYVAMTLLVYDIFKPVNRGLALLAAFFSLVGLGFEALRWNPRGVDIALVFSGLFCLVLGYLTFKSTFVPRIFGAPMAIAGFGWMTYISPPLAEHFAPYNLACGLLGEASLMLWLLVMAVNEERWKMQAGAAGAWRAQRAMNGRQGD